MTPPVKKRIHKVISSCRKNPVASSQGISRKTKATENFARI